MSSHPPSIRPAAGDQDIAAPLCLPARFGREHLDVLAELLEDSETLVAISDPQDYVVYANAVFRKTFFIAPDERVTFADVMRRNLAAGRGVNVQADDAERWLLQALSRRHRSPYRQFESDMKNGRWFLFSETTIPSGWMLTTAVDITDMRGAHKELRSDRDLARKAAETDDLTGISNRRHIMKLLDDIVSGRSAFGQDHSVACLLDLDHFKKINDRFGHQAGDAVITGFAALVRKAVRNRDCFGRIGGEEFLLLLPDTALKDATVMLSRIYDQLRDVSLVAQDPAQRVTFSTGMTAFHRGDTADGVFARCDAALYRAKNGGRNQVQTVASPPSHS